MGRQGEPLNVRLLLRARNNRGAPATATLPQGLCDIDHHNLQVTAPKASPACIAGVRAPMQESSDRENIGRCAQGVRSRMPRWREAKITMPDINRVRSDRVIFVQPARFALVFVTRRRASRHAHCTRGRHPYPSRNNVVRDLSQTVCASANAKNAAKRGPNVCLSRHNSALAERKSAARLSRPGPFCCFFLRCGRGVMPHVLPARITRAAAQSVFAYPWWSFVVREA